MTSDHDSAAKLMLEIFDFSVNRFKEKHKQTWQRYLSMPSDGQIAFYRTGDNGIINFDMDSTFFAEQIVVFAKRSEYEIINNMNLGNQIWMKAEDCASSRVFTEGKAPLPLQYDDTENIPFNAMVPPSAWAPCQVDNPQFDYIAVLPCEQVVPRAGALQFTFWVVQSQSVVTNPLPPPNHIVSDFYTVFNLDPRSSNQSMFFPVTLIGHKVFG